MIGIINRLIKTSVKKIFNMFGLDVIRIENNPEKTLLGLRNLPIKTIIDVGANTGQFAKYILKFFPEACIYSFEPLPQHFEELKRWAELYGNGKIIPFNLALGEKEGAIEMLMHTEHSFSSSLLKTTELCKEIYPFTKSQTIVNVNMIILDKMAEGITMPLESEILIKLDVQGYEDRVIRGGKEIFSKAKVCILEVNLDHLYEGQPSFYQLSSLLDGLGFQYAGNLNQVYADDGHMIFIDAVFVR